MSEVTVREIIEAKAALVANVAACVKIFEDKTEVQVQSIVAETEMSGDSDTGYVRELVIDVSLDI